MLCLILKWCWALFPHRSMSCRALEIPTIWQDFVSLWQLLELLLCFFFVLWVFVRVPLQGQLFIPKWKINIKFAKSECQIIVKPLKCHKYTWWQNWSIHWWGKVICCCLIGFHQLTPSLYLLLMHLSGPLRSGSTPPWRQVDHPEALWSCKKKKASASDITAVSL